MKVKAEWPKTKEILLGRTRACAWGVRQSLVSCESVARRDQPLTLASCTIPKARGSSASRPWICLGCSSWNVHQVFSSHVLYECATRHALFANLVFRVVCVYAVGAVLVTSGARSQLEGTASACWRMWSMWSPQQFEN